MFKAKGMANYFKKLDELFKIRLDDFKFLFDFIDIFIGSIFVLLGW